MKRLLINILLLLILITSCKKVGNGSVSGTVTEEGSGLPFANVGVYIERKTFKDGKQNPTIVANTITDASGHYSLPFYMQRSNGYRIFCTPLPDAAGDTYTKESSEGVPTKNEQINFTLPPFAYIKVSYHKASYTISKSSYIQFDHRKSVDLNDPSHPIDTVLGVFRVVGNRSLHITTFQTYNTPTEWRQELDTVYINKGDTLSYLIDLD
jgi:hypothetical protein